MNASEQNQPTSMAQLLSWVRLCSTQEKRLLLKELLDDTSALTIASEPSLSKDWSGEEEDEAWKDL